MVNKSEDEFNKRDALFFVIMIISVIMAIWVTSLVLDIIWVDIPYVARLLLTIIAIIFVIGGLVEVAERRNPVVR